MGIVGCMLCCSHCWLMDNNTAPLLNLFLIYFLVCKLVSSSVCLFLFIYLSKIVCSETLVLDGHYHFCYDSTIEFNCYL